MTTEAPRTWTHLSQRLLSPGRLRAQAIVLALCVCGVIAFDFSKPGLFDRAGNIKFQDFLPVYVSARLIAEHRATELYNQDVQADALQAIVRQPGRVETPNLYGPQVGLLFVPLGRFSFLRAAWIWITVSLLAYFACGYLVWACCRNLGPRCLVLIAAVAYPPLFHLFVRGQISALLLLSFTAAFFALRSRRFLLAGVALGFLAIKPQFLVAIPLVLLLSGSWQIFAGLLLSVAAQFVLARLYLGSEVMPSYFVFLAHPSRWMNLAELSLAPIQMHSLRSFWTLLVPVPALAFAFYFVTSVIAVGITIRIWKSVLPLPVRYSALILAAVLVNPHLFIYDLLVLAPALLLLADWSLTDPQLTSSLPLLLYLAFLLPLLGPLSRWTHIQLSVLAFAAILWILYRSACIPTLASGESRVV